jgi:hypothetical protein
MRQILGRDNVYHITEGGRGGRRGCPLSEETKKKISEKLKGKVSPRKGVKLTDEQKQNMSNIAKKLGFKPPNHRGRKLTEEHKQKLSLINKGKPGKPLSKEHKQKLLESHLGKVLSKETRQKLSNSHKGKGAYNYIHFTDEQITTIKQDQRSVRIIAKDYDVSYSKIQAIRGKIGKRKRILSDEHKQKLSEAKKGKPSNNKGKVSNRKGKTWKIIDGKRIWMNK